jgi:hypothetical protein
VNVLVGLLGVATVPPVPDTIVHAPVPITGVLAARVTVVRPHVAAPVWSGPALAIVGVWLKVILTSSLDGAQGVLVIVHLRTYVVPAVPVKVLVGLESAVIVPPVPDTIDHAPVPTTGLLAARVTVVSPHVDAPV